MAALNTTEVGTLLQRVAHRPGQMFTLGVLPADCLPSLSRLQDILRSVSLCCFVANTDPAKLPGKHWVLFIASRVRGGIQLEYFDSYGLPMVLYTDVYNDCGRKRLLPLIKVYSTLSLQDVSSSVCGHYCILFAHFRAMGHSFKFILDYLRRSGVTALERDKFVVTTLHSILHRYCCAMHTSCLVSKGLQQSCCRAAMLK
jgi:hypothetical protein